MQDLSELTDQLDLEAALARTHERHQELLHERAVRRRFVTTGAFAAVIVAAVVLLPQLGSDDRGQAVRFAGSGGSSTSGSAASQDADGAAGDSRISHLPRPLAVPSDFLLTEDTAADGGVVWVLTRKPETLSPVPTTVMGDGVVLGSGIAETRAVEQVSLAAVGDQNDVVTANLACVGAGDEITEVRYRFVGNELIVYATVRSGPTGVACADGGAGTNVDLPLDREWEPQYTVVATKV